VKTVLPPPPGDSEGTAAGYGHHPRGEHIVTPQMAHLGVDTCHRTPTETVVTQQRKPCWVQI